MTQAVEVKLPKLHTGRNGSGGQVAVDECPARFIICFCGRRWGKTLLGVRKCIKGALEKPNGIYWWIGPSYPVISNSRAWPLLKLMANQLPGTEIKESDKYVKFHNGSEIWIKSADKEDSLRGPGLSGAVLDEFAQIRESSWTDEIRPALSDHKGWALFIGTPKGRGWSYKLFEKAQFRENWATFKRPSIDNPFLDPAEIEEAKEELTEEKFKQEYEADFGSSQYLVWPQFDRNVHKWTEELPKFTAYYGGLDFGGDTVGAHLSTGVVAGLTERDELIFLSEFAQSGTNIGERQLEWMSEVQEICKAIDHRSISRPHQIRWNADRTQMWGIQLVRNMGFVIHKTKGGKDSVIQGVDAVARRLEVRYDRRPRLFYLPHLHFIPEAFELYRYAEPKEGDLPQMSNPLKVNDDMPDAIRYCVEGKDRAVIGDPGELYRNTLPVVESDGGTGRIAPRFKLHKKQRRIPSHAR